MPETKKAALITGAASGIGRATALALAAPGYNVASNYNRSADAAGETAALAQAKGAVHCCSNVMSAMTTVCARCGPRLSKSLAVLIRCSTTRAPPPM